MKTAAYTICKNEINRVDQWIYYTKDFDYRVVLDTGSTDGTYEALQKVPGIILEQLIMPKFRFDIPRNYNLNMIPEDVEWCLSPDMDEYFSINVLEEVEKMEKEYPKVTNISCARLDIYSKHVFVGQPNSIGTNKIHRRHMYDWKQRVYEHLSYTGTGQEYEYYNKDIFLIHDQEIDKPRSTLYFKLMLEEYEENPSNSWNNWFLLNHYYREKDLENFVDVSISYVCASDNTDEKKRTEVYNELINIYRAMNIPYSIKSMIKNSLNLL